MKPTHDPLLDALREALRREIYPIWAMLRRASGQSTDPAEYARQVTEARDKRPISGGSSGVAGPDAERGE